MQHGQDSHQREYELEEDELALGGDDELEQAEDTVTEGDGDTETGNDDWELGEGEEEDLEDDGATGLVAGDTDVLEQSHPFTDRSATAATVARTTIDPKKITGQPCCRNWWASRRHGHR